MAIFFERNSSFRNYAQVNIYFWGGLSQSRTIAVMDGTPLLFLSARLANMADTEKPIPRPISAPDMAPMSDDVLKCDAPSTFPTIAKIISEIAGIRYSMAEARMTSPSLRLMRTRWPTCASSGLSRVMKKSLVCPPNDWQAPFALQEPQASLRLTTTWIFFWGSSLVTVAISWHRLVMAPEV